MKSLGLTTIKFCLKQKKLNKVISKIIFGIIRVGGGYKSKVPRPHERRNMGLARTPELVQSCMRNTCFVDEHCGTFLLLYCWDCDHSLFSFNLQNH